MWIKEMIKTERGKFEFFVSGEGDPLCVTHLYSEFDERGYYFADMFTDHFKVYLVNLKEAGTSSKVQNEKELGMVETVNDLETVRESLGYKQWAFAGHSTGGMIGLVYSIYRPESLAKIMVGGASASNEYMGHKDSMYSMDNPLNSRLKELLSIIKSSNTSREDRIKANREWNKMSLYAPDNFDTYFSKPSSGRIVQKRLDYYSFVELPNYDIRGKLSTVEVPAYVYCGKYDSQCPSVFSIEINDLLQNSKLYIFEESNHSPFLEETKRFNKMILDFVTI